MRTLYTYLETQNPTHTRGHQNDIKLNSTTSHREQMKDGKSISGTGFFANLGLLVRFRLSSSLSGLILEGLRLLLHASSQSSVGSHLLPLESLFCSRSEMVYSVLEMIQCICLLVDKLGYDIS